MDLDDVEGGRGGAARRRAIGLAHPVEIGPIHRLRYLALVEIGDGRRRVDRPVAVFQRLVVAFPRAPRRGLAPGMAELDADLGRGVLVDEIDHPLPGADVFGLIDAGAAGRDAAFALDIGHLGEHQPGAAHGAAAEMDEMKIVGRAVVGRIHAHRRHHDTVRHRHAAQAERREHGCHGTLVRHVLLPLGLIRRS